MSYVYAGILLLAAGYLYVNISVLNKNIDHILKEHETFLEEESNNSADPIQRHQENNYINGLLRFLPALYMKKRLAITHVVIMYMIFLM
jgi:hypothetical protein